MLEVASLANNLLYPGGVLKAASLVTMALIKTAGAKVVPQFTHVQRCKGQRGEHTQNYIELHICYETFPCMAAM